MPNAYSILLNARALKAVSFAAAESCITRPYLEGVNIEIADGQATMAATDSHMLIAARSKCAVSMDANIPPSFTVPASLFAKMKLGPRSSELCKLTITEGECRLEHDDYESAGSLLDITYPDWRRVVPETCDGKTDQFDVELLARFYQANRALSAARGLSSNPVITHNGGGPALVSLAANEAIETVGVIMPFYAKNLANTPPDWAIKCTKLPIKTGDRK